MKRSARQGHWVYGVLILTLLLGSVPLQLLPVAAAAARPIGPTTRATAALSAMTPSSHTPASGESFGTPTSTPSKWQPHQQPDGVTPAVSFPAQTISSAGPLTQIVLGNDLSCQVAYARDGGFEFFPALAPGDCGTFLVV